MSKPVSTELFDLIQSLDKAEKRYFKLFASVHQDKDSTSLEIFDAVAAQKEYDEPAILKKTKIPAAHFSTYKKYLYEIVLKSLRGFHEKTTSVTLSSSEKKRIKPNCFL